MSVGRVVVVARSFGLADSNAKTYLEVAFPLDPVAIDANKVGLTLWLLSKEEQRVDIVTVFIQALLM